MTKTGRQYLQKVEIWSMSLPSLIKGSIANKGRASIRRRVGLVPAWGRGTQSTCTVQ